MNTSSVIPSEAAKKAMLEWFNAAADVLGERLVKPERMSDYTASCADGRVISSLAALAYPGISLTTLTNDPIPSQSSSVVSNIRTVIQAARENKAMIDRTAVSAADIVLMRTPVRLFMLLFYLATAVSRASNGTIKAPAVTAGDVDACRLGARSECCDEQGVADVAAGLQTAIDRLAADAAATSGAAADARRRWQDLTRQEDDPDVLRTGNMWQRRRGEEGDSDSPRGYNPRQRPNAPSPAPSPTRPSAPSPAPGTACARCAELAAQLSAANSQRSAAMATLRQIRDEFGIIQSELESCAAEKTEHAREVAMLRGRITATESDRQEYVDECVELRQRVESLAQMLSSAQAGAQAAEERAQASDDMVCAIRARSSAAEAKVVELAQTVDTLQNTVNELNEKQHLSESDLAGVRMHAEKLRAELTEANNAANDKQIRIAQLNEQVAQLTIDLAAVAAKAPAVTEYIYIAGKRYEVVDGTVNMPQGPQPLAQVLATMATETSDLEARNAQLAQQLAATARQLSEANAAAEARLASAEARVLDAELRAATAAQQPAHTVRVEYIYIDGVAHEIQGDGEDKFVMTGGRVRLLSEIMDESIAKKSTPAAAAAPAPAPAPVIREYIMINGQRYLIGSDAQGTFYTDSTGQRVSPESMATPATAAVAAPVAALVAEIKSLKSELAAAQTAAQTVTKEIVFYNGHSYTVDGEGDDRYILVEGRVILLCETSQPAGDCITLNGRRCMIRSDVSGMFFVDNGVVMRIASASSAPAPAPAAPLSSPAPTAALIEEIRTLKAEVARLQAQPAASTSTSVSALLDEIATLKKELTAASATAAATNIQATRVQAAAPASEFILVNGQRIQVEGTGDDKFFILDGRVVLLSDFIAGTDGHATTDDNQTKARIQQLEHALNTEKARVVDLTNELQSNDNADTINKLRQQLVHVTRELAAAKADATRQPQPQPQSPTLAPAPALAHDLAPAPHARTKSTEASLVAHLRSEVRRLEHTARQDTARLKSEVATLRTENAALRAAGAADGDTADLRAENHNLHTEVMTLRQHLSQRSPAGRTEQPRNERQVAAELRRVRAENADLRRTNEFLQRRIEDIRAEDDSFAARTARFRAGTFNGCATPPIPAVRASSPGRAEEPDRAKLQVRVQRLSEALATARGRAAAATARTKELETQLAAVNESQHRVSSDVDARRLARMEQEIVRLRRELEAAEGRALEGTMQSSALEASLRRQIEAARSRSASLKTQLAKMTGGHGDDDGGRETVLFCSPTSRPPSNHPHAPLPPPTAAAPVTEDAVTPPQLPNVDHDYSDTESSQLSEDVGYISPRDRTTAAAAATATPQAPAENTVAAELASARTPAARAPEPLGLRRRRESLCRRQSRHDSATDEERPRFAGRSAATRKSLAYQLPELPRTATTSSSTKSPSSRSPLTAQKEGARGARARGSDIGRSPPKAAETPRTAQKEVTEQPEQVVHEVVEVLEPMPQPEVEVAGQHSEHSEPEHEPAAAAAAAAAEVEVETEAEVSQVIIDEEQSPSYSSSDDYSHPTPEPEPHSEPVSEAEAEEEAEEEAEQVAEVILTHNADSPDGFVVHTANSPTSTEATPLVDHETFTQVSDNIPDSTPAPVTRSEDESDVYSSDDEIDVISLIKTANTAAAAAAAAALEEEEEVIYSDYTYSVSGSEVVDYDPPEAPESQYEHSDESYNSYS